MKFEELYSSINAKNLEIFITETKDKIKKELKPNAVFNLIFKKAWNEKELRSMKKASIQASLSYLEFLLNEHGDGFEKSVRNCLADLYEYYIEVFSESHTSSWIFNVNNIPTSIYFQLSKNIFYQNSIPDKLQKGSYLDLPATYLLRLCLEGRIHGLLGIDYIRVGEGSIPLSDILKIVQNLKSIKFSSEIKWERITQINDWLNHYIHRNLRPTPWCIHYAFQEMEPFFKTGMREFGNTKSYSSYASAFLENKEVFQIELLNRLEERYPTKKISIKWSGLHEVHLKKEIS